MISHAEFREDLYYRLNVIPLTIPPLRDRMEDILPLLKYFTDKYNKAFDKSIKGFSEQTIHTIMAYHWPGNIRELENAVEYAFNIETSSYILKESLPAKLTEGNDIQQLSGIKTLEEIERETIKTTMNHYDNTLDGKKQLASALGIGIATLYRKLNYYNLSYK
jgi:transcriptional regulator with PAS, ATPase and Fis domain